MPHQRKRSKPSAPSPRAAAALAVHDGTEFVGSISERGGKHHAFDVRGKLIGIFSSRIAAIRVIPTIRKSAASTIKNREEKMNQVTKTRKRLTRYERVLPLWQAAMQKAWLRDHPGKTQDDYERAGSCSDTDRGIQAYHKWSDEWLSREGEVIHRRLFGRLFG